MNNQLFFSSDYDITLLDHIKDEYATVGHHELPEQNIDYLNTYVKQVQTRQPFVKEVVIVGIGGSNLGTQAIYEFLKGANKFSRNLSFLDSTNPDEINGVIGSIDIKNAHFAIISKSGDTLEVIALYKHLLTLVEHYGDIGNRFSFISQKDSNLTKYANSIGAISLDISRNVSGRFSVFSAVGLAPLALLGVDIANLLAGARAVKERFFNQGDLQATLLTKANYYAKNSSHITINSLFSYSQSLHYFNQWFVQLWAESLGKQQTHSHINVGLTPIGLIGPKDQHSFLQLLAQGKHDKSVTFIKLKARQDISIPTKTLQYLEYMDTLDGLSFSELISMQADATLEALKSYGDIPIDVIELPTQDETSIGGLIYYFELLTSLVGKLMGVNTYNQPGVELTKIILKEKLQQTKG